MSTPPVFQTITPPHGVELLTLDQLPSSQAGVQIREFFKTRRVEEPSVLDFTMPFSEVGSFLDTSGWNEENGGAKRNWRPTRRAGRYVLVADGRFGASLLVERLEAQGSLTADERVRVHPYPLSLTLGVPIATTHGEVFLDVSVVGDGTGISVGSDPEEGSGAPIEALPSHHDIPRRLDAEILAWGAVFSELFEEGRAGGTRWPTSLCRNVLPYAGRRSEMISLLEGIGVAACERFGYADGTELVLGAIAWNRPNPLRAAPLKEGLFINLRGVLIPNDMKDWLEAVYCAQCARRWPLGWYEAIGPTTSSRLGVSGRAGRASIEIKGPFSNHQRMTALAAVR